MLSVKGGRPNTLKGPQRTRLSKALTHLLRHNAVEAGLTIDAAGYASVTEVLAAGPIRYLHATPEHIQEVVRLDKKNRFDLTSDGKLRCNQGHSGSTAAAVDNQALCTLITLSKAQDAFPEVMHGTFARHMPAILEQGLSRGSRRHIHLTPLRPGDQAVMSGFRASSEVLVHIDMPAAIEAGITFWLSANGVILTEGNETGHLPPTYIRQVEHLKGE